MGKQKRSAANASKSLTLEQLSGYFHKPINEVAVELGVCVTVLKQRCREFGITRWPYRKVRKLDAIISALESGAPDGEAEAAPGGAAAAAGPLPAVSAVEVTERLATVKQTRELLLQNPNSTAHLQLGKVKTVRKPTTSSENVGEGSPSRPRPIRPRRAAPASAPPAPSPHPMSMASQLTHGMMPPGMEGGASMDEAQRSAMQLYAAYSSASAFSNAMYLAGGGVAGLPRGGSGNSLDGSVPIRPIATSGSFSNALTAHGVSAEAAAPAAPAAAPAAAADSADVPAEAAALPTSGQPRTASPLARAAEGADMSGAVAPVLPPNPAAGGHLFFQVGGLTMPPMLPMPHMMPMVGPMGVFYGPGFANMPMHLAAHGMPMRPGLHAGMPMMPWPVHPPQPPQPR